jgi:hypothetical protein
MKRFLALAFLVCVAAVADKGSGDDDALEALTILTKQCAGCHNKAEHPGRQFLERASLTDPQVAGRMLRMIETASMPPEHKAFRKTAEGRKVIAFLREQATRGR